MKDITFKFIKQERKRQNNNIELIASENFVSKDILKAMGSCLTNKYAEGYPQHRYYGGCEYIDKIEDRARELAKLLFHANFANVQPHSGSQANAAAYEALRRKLVREHKINRRQMRILTMDLNSGSHLTHGSKVSFSSHLYHFDFFKLGKDDKLDFDIIEKAIIKYKPDVLLSGYSAYPYKINFKAFRQLADKYNLLFMVDMAHIAGLVACGACDNPVEYADIVTSTTHKTLRGPRGGLILTNDIELANYINSAVFPYYQGGPLEHVIAAKAICFKEALLPKFRNYIMQVLINTSSCSMRLKDLGAECSGTDNHLFLLNVKKSYNMTGLEAQKALEEIGITTNKNMIPNDTETPNTTSGLRIGFAAITTRGCTSQMAINIATLIHDYLSHNITTEEARKEVKKIVKHLKKVR